MSVVGSQMSEKLMDSRLKTRLRLLTSDDRHLNSALTDCKLMVSGSISLPSRGAFHLSLTVLSAIGCQVVFSLGRWSSRIHTGFLVPRATRVPVLRAFKVSATGLLPSAVRLSRQPRLPQRFVTLKDGLPPALKTEPTTPDRQRR